jgi:hypothetical protein
MGRKNPTRRPSPVVLVRPGDAAVVLDDLRVDEVAAQRLEAFEGAFLVRPHQPRIPRDIGRKYRGEAAGLAHRSSPAASRRPER